MKESVMKENFPENSFSIREKFYSFMVILPVAFLFALKNDLPHVFIITFLLLLLPFFLKKPLPATDRPVIYCVVSAMVLTALPDLMVTYDDARNGLFDILVRSALVLPFLVYVAALGGIFVSSGRLNGIRAALAVTGMLLCGDRFNSRDVHNILLGFLDAFLHHYFEVYVCCALLQGFFLPFFLRAGMGKKIPEEEMENGKSLEKEKRTRKNFYILQSISFILFFSFTFFLGNFIINNPSFLRSVEIYFMRMGSRSMREMTGRYGKKSMISRKVDLRAPLPPWFGQLPNGILFRVKGNFPPGLMRSGVYGIYEHGRWLPLPPAVGRREYGMEIVRRTGLLSFTTFRVGVDPADAAAENNNEAEKKEIDREKDLPDEKKEYKMEMFLDSLISNSIIPVPGNVIRIDAVADEGNMTQTGIFSLKHWKRDGGVTFFVRSPDPESAFNIVVRQGKEKGKDLSVEEKKIYMAVPEKIKKYMLSLFPENSRNLSGREKMAMIRKFLSHPYSYSLYVPPPADKQSFLKDPVLRFLQDTKKGHCELFASAAVLMCRSLGLPARYVTGFVCDEKSPSSRYYFCRLAHAWGEVYLPEERKFVSLETTPAIEMARRSAVRKSNLFQRGLETLKFYGQSFFASVRRGHFAEGILEIFLLLWQGILFLFTTVTGGIFLFFFSLLLLLFWRKRRQRKAGEADIEEERKPIRENWKRFEKEFALLAGKKRAQYIPAETYYRNFSFPGLEEIVREYEKMRFGKWEKNIFSMLLLKKWEKKMEKLLLFMKKEGAKSGKRK